MKRLLSVSLCLLLLLTLLPMTPRAAAAELVEEVRLYIPEPVGGAFPDYTITLPEGALYDYHHLTEDYIVNGSYWWSSGLNRVMQPGDDLFMAGQTYVFNTTLYIDPEEASFPAGAPLSVYVNDKLLDNWTYCVRDDGVVIGVSIEAAFTTDAITLEEMYLDITQPYAGDYPDYTITLPEDALYTYHHLNEGYIVNGSLWWDETEGRAMQPGEDVFVAGRTYVFNTTLYIDTDVAVLPMTHMIPVYANGVQVTEVHYSVLPEGIATGVQIEIPLEALEKKIFGVDVVGYVPPVIGENCAASLADLKIENPDYSHCSVTSAVWYTDGAPLGENDVFNEGESYGLMLELTPDPGWRFNQTLDANLRFGLSPNNPNYFDPILLIDELCGVNPDGTLTLITDSVVPVMPIDEVELTIPAPTAGEIPNYYPTTAEGAPYFVVDTPGNPLTNTSLFWINDTDSCFVKPGTPFEAGKTYRVICELYTAPNFFWRYDPTAITAAVNGEAPEETDRICEVLSLDYIFPPCQENTFLDAVKVIGFDAPPAGRQAGSALYQHSYDESLYEITGAAWYEAGGSAPLAPDAAFTLGNSYCLELTLTAAEGRSFSPNTAAEVWNSRQTETCALDYDHTGLREDGAYVIRTEAIAAIEAIDAVVFDVTEPKVGAVPADSIQTAPDAGFHSIEYPGTDNPHGVWWFDVDVWDFLTPGDCFQAGKVYLLQVELQPDEGQVFWEGMTPQDVTVNGRPASSVWFSNEGALMVEQSFELTLLPVFVDLPAPDNWAYDPILWALENGITNGTDDTHFSPNKTCTRGQVVTFLWRANGSPKPLSDTNPFVDVKVGAFYYDAVLWAVENGITNGTDDTHFGPGKTCTRAQVVTFLWRANGSPAPLSGDNPFEDVKTDGFYYSAMLWAVENEITNGTNATHFSPGKTCTRAQIVTFLYRTTSDVSRFLVKRIWMDNPGEVVHVGDSVEIHVEVVFPNAPGSIVLWTQCSASSDAIKSTVLSPGEAAPDNIYTLSLTITDTMQPGAWQGSWYYISDVYGQYIQKNYSGVEFTIESDAPVSSDPIDVRRIWMDNPGEVVHVGDSVEIHVEVVFPNAPGSIVLWTQCSANSDAIRSIVMSPGETASDNIYTLSLTITDSMQPGAWQGSWYYISDIYGRYVQENYSGVSFIISG